MPGFEQFLNNPRNVGLLQGAFTGMQAAGPSRMPVSFGQGLGAAGSAGLSAFMGAQDRELKRGLLQAQLEGVRLENKYLQDYDAGKPNAGAGTGTGIGTGTGAGNFGPGSPSSPLQSRINEALYLSRSPRKGQRSEGMAILKGLEITTPLNTVSMNDKVKANQAVHIENGKRRQFNVGASDADKSPMLPLPFPNLSTTPGMPGATPGLPAPIHGQAPSQQSAIDLVRQANAQKPPVPMGMGVNAPYNPQGFRPAPQAPTAAPPAAAPAPGRAPFVPPERYPNEPAPDYRARVGKAEEAWRTSNLATERDIAKTARDFGTKESDKYQGIWDDATAKSGQFDILENLFKDPNVVSGAGAETISGLKSLADTFGVKTDGVAAEDTIRAIATNMALKAKMEGGKNLLPGAMSEAENAMLAAMVPGLSQTREGRMLLIQVLRAKTQKEKKIAELAFAYEDKHGKIDRGFHKEAREWGQANPMYSAKRMEAMMLHAKRLASGKN